MEGKLSHLSKEQIEELMKRYYEKEKVSDLISEYNLEIKHGGLAKHLPPEVLEENCSYCDVKLIRIRGSREYEWWRKTPGHCPNCGHQDDESCSCKKCKDLEWIKQEREKLHKQEFIDRWVDSKDEKINLEDLTLIDKIYLGALLREGISEDYSFIKPIEYFINPLAPTNELCLEIIIRLKEIKAIAVHPTTEHKYIIIKEYESGHYSYFPYEVKWSLNVKSDEFNKVEMIESIINPKDLDNSQNDEALQLWKQLALYESIEYLKHSVANTLGIDCEIREKTKAVLSELGNDYSVAQIYGIIYKATNNALRFRAEKGVPIKHAANSIIGNAQSYGERAKINNWDLQKYNREKACHESALSKFFFERIIKIGYDGFKEVPNISKMPNKLSESADGIDTAQAAN